jgi:molybdenum cofactor cytidylyltransferase
VLRHLFWRRALRPRLGQPKQLVEFHGERLVDRAIRIAHEAGASPIFVVLGADYPSILKALEERADLRSATAQVRILINKSWEGGMSSSIAQGTAAAVHVGADDLLILTCDQPAVTPEHLLRLIDTSKREHVVASHYAGRRGVPALFPEFAFHALQELNGDSGARDVLQEGAVLTVPLSEGDFDLDTPADLAHLHRMEGPLRVRINSSSVVASE